MNITIVQLFLLRMSSQMGPSFIQPGLDLSLATKLHNLNIYNSKFSYFSSELLKSSLNSANILILNSNFDHFLSPSLTISSRTTTFSKQNFSERVDFPDTTTKLKLKECTWSNFLSTSDKGGCFGIEAICEATITECSFINIIINTIHTTGKGAFMVISSHSSGDDTNFTFCNNIMTNISSINLLNNPLYHAFYVINRGPSTFDSNSMTLFSKGGSYSSLLQSLTTTIVSYSNFTDCDCTIGSGINVEFFDQSSTKIRYSLLSKLGGFEILRLSCAEEAVRDPSSESKFATVYVENVAFFENDGTFLISLNNNIAGPEDDDFSPNFGIFFYCKNSQFFGNANMTYPIHVKVPKLNVFSIEEFLNCVSESELVMQPEIEGMFGYTLSNGWSVVNYTKTESPSPFQTPKPSESQKVTDDIQTPTFITETATTVPDITTETATTVPDVATETATTVFDIVQETATTAPDIITIIPETATTAPEPEVVIKDGDVFTTTETTSSSLLIQGHASINIDELRSLHFSSYGQAEGNDGQEVEDASRSSQIDLFGNGISDEIGESESGVELTFSDFKNVTVNVLTDSVLTLPIVVSEVSNFEINGGNFHQGQSEGQNEITIKRLDPPTRGTFTSHVRSNSKLTVRKVNFSPSNTLKPRIHQTIASHSNFESSIVSLSINENVDAEIDNFSLTEKVMIKQGSNLRLKQTRVNKRTVIEYDANSIDKIGQIEIEKPLTMSFFSAYLFAPHEIRLKLFENSESDKKVPIVKGLDEDNCKQMFVNFKPQTNLQGIPYRSVCEDDQLFVSIQSDDSKSQPKSKGLNNGIIAAIVVCCITALALSAVLIYIKVRKSKRAIVDPSDNFDVSPTIVEKSDLYV